MFFLWAFLPITIILYYIVPRKCRNVLLLFVSLFFYAWGEPVYVLLMILSIFVNWIVGILMEKYQKWNKTILVFDILFNLGLLGYFKYSGFLVETLNRIFNTEITIRAVSLPIGISFFTFQILSYIIDLYRGKYKAQHNIINLALYISFFPQLIAGPIVKYIDIEDQINNRVESFEKFSMGARRFIYGLAKKVIIANTLAIPVDRIYSMDKTSLTGGIIWLVSIMYTFQIYYDFSGYSDMAIGLGKMFGFEFMENFNYPYMATSIQDFWRRWHISLSTWFKEYLYIPLGGNKKGNIRTYINLIIVFFVTGLWHGAGFTFIAWGLYHGFFSIIERLGLRKILAKNNTIGMLYAFLIANFGWVLFRADTISQALSFVKRMLIPWKYTVEMFVWQDYVPYISVFCLFIGIVGCGPIQKVLNKVRITEKLRNSYVEMFYCVVLFVLSVSMLAANSYNPFIYFRF